MVNWESRADRGGRPPNKGRGHKGKMDTKPDPPRGKTPPRETPTVPPAPRGFPIAKRLARSAPHPWTALTVPQRTIQVSPPQIGLPTMLAPAPLSCTSYFSFRPPQGKAVSHRRLPLPRAGSPSYWAPRLDVPPSGPEFRMGDSLSIAGPNLFAITDSRDNLSLRAPRQGWHTPRIHEPISPPPPCTSIGGGEHPHHRGTSRMPGKVLLWPHQAHTKDFSAGNALQRPSPWP